jgi:hypothetical protein
MLCVADAADTGGGCPAHADAQPTGRPRHRCSLLCGATWSGGCSYQCSCRCRRRCTPCKPPPQAGGRAAQQAAGGMQGGAEGGAAAAAADRGPSSDGEPAAGKPSAGSAADGAAAPLQQHEVLPLLPVECLPLRTHWVASAVWHASSCQNGPDCAQRWGRCKPNAVLGARRVQRSRRRSGSATRMPSCSSCWKLKAPPARQTSQRRSG